MSRLTVLCSLLLLSVSTAALAQSPCPTQEILGSAAKRSSDLVCIVPQVYGPGGLVGVDNGGPLTATRFHEVHFQASSINSFSPINAEIGVQLSQVPLASPVSGFIFANGVMQEATSFGPVLADRAETLGKRRIFVGASYEYFDFDKADSVNLRSFGAVFQHEPEPTICATIPSTPCLNGEPIYTNDIVCHAKSDRYQGSPGHDGRHLWPVGQAGCIDRSSYRRRACGNELKCHHLQLSSRRP